MEPLNEFLKRTLQDASKPEAGTPDPEPEKAPSEVAPAEFPTEPFPCPACGQLLAPSCRICVACKHPITAAEISPPQPATSAEASAPNPQLRREVVRYPWPVFFVVLGGSFFIGLIYAAIVTRGLLKEEQAQLAIQAAPILAGVWVFFDALRRHIPRPLRWAIGTMLPAVILPWYLARRRRPRAYVPFVEAEVGPVTRFLLFALLFFFLASLFFYIVKGPPATTPAHPPQEHKSGDSSQPRTARFQSGDRSSRRRITRQGGDAWPVAGTYAETSAPSDAWHT
jgi:hypothetical protein